MNPLVTFALMAYNQERFIREAVEGAFAQTYSPLEIILSDDCSADSTFEIIRDLAAGYRGPSSILLNRNDQNLGNSAHLNKVMELSKGSIVIAAAGDDISLPQRSARIAQRMLSKEEDIYSLFSDAIMISEDGTEQGLLNAKVEAWMREPSRFVRAGLHGVPGACHAWRRELIDRFGPLNKNVAYEDAVIPFRALLLGQIERIPEVLVRYRVHDRSVMRTYRWGTRIGLETWHRRATAHYLNCLKDVARMDPLSLLGWDQVVRELRRRIRFHTASLCISKSLAQYFAVQCSWIPFFGKEAARSAGSAIKMMLREQSVKRPVG